MSSTRKRYTGLLLALLMALGMLATAAPAAVASQAETATVAAANSLDSGVVLFRGRAKIRDNWSGDSCGGSTSGLSFPLFDDQVNDNKCYHFVAPGPVEPGKQASNALCVFAGIVNGAPALDLSCDIEAEGRLKPVEIIPGLVFTAPHCGISASQGGSGTANAAGASVDLSNLGWITSAGSILPVSGSWDSGDGKGDRKLVALVQASGTTNDGDQLIVACTQNKGADSFDVNAIAVLTPVENPTPLDGLLKHPKKDD